MRHRIYIGLLLFGMTATAAVADVIRVPQDQPTIQAGIDASQDGDTVLIADGTYRGAGHKNLDFGGRAIVVRSENGADSCTIDCEGEGQAFRFDSGEGRDSVVEGLTLTGGNMGEPFNDGGAITVIDSDPTIRDCRIVGNRTINGAGGVFMLRSEGLIERCEVANNSAEFAFATGGIRVDDATVTGTVIRGNTGGNGGGLRVAGDGVVSHCSVTGNDSARGAGIYLSSPIDGPVRPVIINCLIADNEAREEGSGVFALFFDGSVRIVNTTITRNRFQGAMFDGGSATIQNSIIWANTSDDLLGRAGVTYSDIEGGWPGTGNIDVDPMFVDAEGGDFRIAAGSPVIDAASNRFVPEGVLVDLAGDPRFVDDPETEDTGEGTPPIVDMGAFEYQALAGGCTRDPAWVCDGDVDGDGQVNPVDSGLVQSAFGSMDEQDVCNYDLDCDGQINPVDSGIVQSLFGTCDAPRSTCP